ncbi:uncharacterized protein N7525_006204 [Penicillium rubens]|nr:uncharacterized protein N7525_006204 [Penicillium rubens]KAJ5827951.1 hypothetical protein N7525_006204 [Penicillium rubens]KAJ5849077.1 hypothetical protein N7534_007766 [Penicillium rubens]
MDNNQGCKITLYWLEQSRSHRILWLLEELKLEYELKIFKRRADKLAPAELKEVHPLGKSPVITIQAPGATKPLVLAESGAIVEYLCDHFSSARPTLVPQRYTPGSEGKVGGETEEWMRYRYFMHYVEGSLMPFLVMTLVNDSIRNAPPFFVRPITSIVASQVENQFLTRNVEGSLAFLEDQLRTSPEGGQYICGKELTAADILLSFPVIAVTMRVLKEEKNKERYPLLVEYANRLERNEGYQRAVKKIEEIEGKFSASMTKTDYIIQLIHHHVTFNFNPGDACKRCRFCVYASSLSATMAGPSKSLVLDPALQKYYELNANRYKYWRWTPRHAMISFVYMGLIPGVLGYVAYKYEGQFEFRGKRRGDSIAEW